MRRYSEWGFTLIELVCVVALLGIIAFITMPVVSGIAGSRNLEIAANALAMDFRKAQQKAITEGNVQRIEFRIYNDDYRVRDYGSGTAYTVKLPEGVTYRSVNFPAEGGHPQVSFYRSGAPSRGGTVGLTDAKGRVKYVILTPATGRVRIADSPPDN